METEGKKYSAYSFNIAGFSLFVPLGKVVLEPVSMFNEFGIYGLVGYVGFSLFLVIIGLSLIIHGRDILNK